MYNTRSHPCHNFSSPLPSYVTPLHVHDVVFLQLPHGFPLFPGLPPFLGVHDSPSAHVQDTIGLSLRFPQLVLQSALLSQVLSSVHIHDSIPPFPLQGFPLPLPPPLLPPPRLGRQLTVTIPTKSRIMTTFMMLTKSSITQIEFPC